MLLLYPTNCIRTQENETILARTHGYSLLEFVTCALAVLLHGSAIHRLTDLYKWTD